MSTNENQRQAHMTLMAHKICGVFATSSLALQLILFHIYIAAEGHYMLCSIEEIFLKKRRAELFDYGVATVMSKVTHMLHGVHGVVVRFALAHLNLISIHPSSISCALGTS